MEHQPSVRQYALNHFQAAFVPSQWRKIAVLVMSGALLIGVAVFHFGTMRWVACMAIIGIAMWSWRESPDFIQRIFVQQHVHLQINQQILEARLLSGSLISRYVCCLRWQCGQRIIWQWILPDMLPENDFRRIRVWAKWCQY